MSAILVSDTISEIMERISSLRGFGHNITENIKYHLTVIKDKCSGPAKLDLSDPATREWVGQVTDLFYLVDDLCADAALLSKQSKTVSSFSACKRTPLLQLKQIEKQLLREVAPMKNAKMLPNRDAEQEEEAETAVRDCVKETITNSILKKEKGVVRAVVIPGITGLGNKARAVKYVCEDEKVKNGFDVVTWIHGVDLQEHFAEFVVDRVNHELEEKKKDSSEGKGFFVVLDDFHNENHEEWLKLAEKLNELARTSSGGAVLLVITWSEVVADLVRFLCSFQSAAIVRFDTLDHSKSRPLIQRIAKTSWSAIESETRDALLDMCGGILGAIETMGRLVRFRKPTTEPEIKQLKDEFVQEMQLKYYSELDLPSSWRLRQCFAYYLFLLSSKISVKPENLVRLWMAEGFLGHSSSQQPEDLGHECLQEFLRGSIFKVFEDENGQISNTGRSLAAVVVGNDNVYVKDKGIIDKDVRRLSLSSDLDVSKGIPRSLSETNKNVLTFLLESNFLQERQARPPNLVMLNWFTCDDILSAFRRLRMLTLKDLGIKVLPASIGDLKSLRYLDLSYNDFEILPIYIVELQHLQTLLLSHCLKLTELPDNLNRFASLRHLEVDQCPNLMHMPSALKKLTWLRSLPHFVASDRNGIGELMHLNELRGELEISHLERVKFKGSRLAHAYLKEKQHLEGLTLRWNDDGEDGEKKHSSDEEDQNGSVLLTHLVPHPNLKRLSFAGYRGNQFPGWLLSLNKLVEISLYNCPTCQYLPIEDGVLANLKRLTLMSLGSLQYITVTDKDNGCKELRLEQVRIWDCPNLTSWWKPGTQNTTIFTAISNLVVEYCPKLVSMPVFPAIDNRLVLDYSNYELLRNTLMYKSTGSDSSPPLSRLKHLTIIKVDEKQYPQQEWLKNFTSLARLEIRDCKALKSIKGWKHLTSLDRLLISHCTDIDLPSEEWQGLKALGRLIIEDISDLESLPEGIQFLTSLDTLEIKGCPKLKTVPEAISDALYFTYFVIDDCPKLVTLPESLVEFAVLNIRNSPLLESWNQSRPKFATQDTQEEKNSTAPNINRSSSKHEIQNVYQGTDSFVGCPRCIHCTNSLRIIPLLERWNQSRPKFATQDTQEEQNSTAPNINRSSSKHEIQNVYHGTDSPSLHSLH